MWPLAYLGLSLVRACLQQLHHHSRLARQGSQVEGGVTCLRAQQGRAHAARIHGTHARTPVIVREEHGGYQLASTVHAFV